MRFLTKSFYVAEYWLPAIVNGDFSGMSDKDESDLNQWLQDHPGEIYLPSENVEFGTDEISGLFANCVRLDVLNREK